MEFAVSSIRDVTGINLDLIWLRDVNQLCIPEARRKQAAVTRLIRASRAGHPLIGDQTYTVLLPAVCLSYGAMQRGRQAAPDVAYPGKFEQNSRC